MEQPPTQVTQIETNLDDATGEVIASVLRSLFELGALDAWTTPIVMKHGRPGVTVSVLCADEHADSMAESLIELTGSFGVRFCRWQRLVVERDFHTVQTSYGPIRIKTGRLGGRVVVHKPEFADIEAAAAKAGVPERRVHAAALAAARDQEADA